MAMFEVTVITPAGSTFETRIEGDNWVVLDGNLWIEADGAKVATFAPNRWSFIRKIGVDAYAAATIAAASAWEDR